MKRSFQSFSITDLSETKSQMLSWCNRFNICAFLDNHHYQLPGHSYECLAGCGTVATVKAQAGNALNQLQAFLDLQNDWCFGHLNYQLAAETESLECSKPDPIGFPDLYFFVPEYVFQLSATEIKIGSLKADHAAVFAEIHSLPIALIQQQPVHFKERISREQYLQAIETVQKHILRGDCYELNYCMEFFAENIAIHPVSVYQALTQISPNPFAAFYKVEEAHLLCASPERFLRKEGNQLISQPIKGTLKRNTNNQVADELLKHQLYQSEKDRSENVMVVDLVRNDLSRVCKEGTVEVEELFGIYSFPQVHQMISTIRGEINPRFSLAEILRATFPMGSMTGAPKRKVVELIHQYEATGRGIFSGAVGYIAPNGNFDFNVVIRSVLYNAATQYLSYLVGSGITFYSDAEQEYEECLLKASAIKKVLA